MRGDDWRTPRALLVGVVAAWLASAAPAWAQPTAADVAAAESAARRAVQDVFGPEAAVRLGSPVLTLAPGSGVVVAAVPEPSSRTGGPVRFVLYGDLDQTRRVGRLTARVDVDVPHVRAASRVAARVTPGASDVEVVRGDIGRQLLQALPGVEVVTLATTRKALAPGEVITVAALVRPSLVASGQEVVTVARVGVLEVRGRAVAAQSGQLGDTVYVVNPDTRRRLRGRVVADALVEVFLGS